MTAAERKKKIAAYAAGPKLLALALKKLPPKMWKWKPTPQKWSVHEILVHLADSESNAYLRARRFLAEPGGTVMAYDQDVWAQKLRYHAQDPRDAVALVTLVRRMTHRLIRNLPEAAWAARCTHPEHDNYTFDRWLDIYSHHIHGHIAQMQRNLAAWKLKAGRRK
jgi:hypothetical protein